jgi:DNA-binding HxlR family transcriptional regulator
MTPARLDDAARLWAHVFAGQPHLLALFTGFYKADVKRLEMPATRFYAHDHLDEALAWAAQQDGINRECYFCAHQLLAEQRKKEHAAPVLAVYADVDGASLERSPIRPTALVESSPGKAHLYARLNRAVAPAQAERLNKRWALAFGADPSGYDLSQVLRVPGTHNRKYDGAPLVRLQYIDEQTVYDPDDLERVLPPLPEKAREHPLFDADAGLDSSDPPVRLNGAALELWHGTGKWADAGDRSMSLMRLGHALARANASEHTIVAALRDRDQALGWRKFSDRDDRDKRYADIAAAAMRALSGERDDDDDRWSPAEAHDEASKRETRSHRAFVLTPLEELLGEPEESVPYIVDGMLPSGGVSMFVAKPKVGKSTAARSLAFAVAAGEPFLGRETIQGPVIYLALEEKRAEVANHFRRMGASDQPIFVHVGAAPATSQEGIAALEAAILEHHAIMAIADPALKLVRVRDASDYAEMLKALEPVVELARRTNCHIGVCHHAGKLERPGGDDVLGSTALFGSVDTLVLLRRRDYGRTLGTIQRYGQDLAESVIPLDEHTGLVQLGGDIDSVKVAQAGDGIKKVLGELKDDEEDLDEAEIRQRVEARSLMIARALRVLVADGSVSRSGAGKKGDPYRYRLAKNTRSLDPTIYGDLGNEKNSIGAGGAEDTCEECGAPLQPGVIGLCAACIPELGRA